MLKSSKEGGTGELVRLTVKALHDLSQCRAGNRLAQTGFCQSEFSRSPIQAEPSKHDKFVRVQEQLAFFRDDLKTLRALDPSAPPGWTACRDSAPLKGTFTTEQ